MSYIKIYLYLNVQFLFKLCILLIIHINIYAFKKVPLSGLVVHDIHVVSTKWAQRKPG